VKNVSLTPGLWSNLTVDSHGAIGYLAGNLKLGFMLLNDKKQTRDQAVLSGHGADDHMTFQEEDLGKIADTTFLWFPRKNRIHIKRLIYYFKT
jgi:hypothetical protein